MSSDRGLRFPATNSIFYGRIKPDKRVLMRLLYSTCVPISTYAWIACAVKDYSAADMLRCHVAINAIRKIVSFAVWQSIRHVRMSYGFDSIYELFEKAECKFRKSASKSSNSVILQLSSLAVL